MSRFLLIFFAFAAVLLATLALQCGEEKRAYSTAPRQEVSPEGNRGSMPDERVRFRVTPQPVRAMKPLHFQVDLQHYGEPQSVMVDLSMPHMIMGVNRIAMKKSSPGVYEGVGILPICPSGRKTWQASVIIDNHVASEYIFDVQY